MVAYCSLARPIYAPCCRNRVRGCRGGLNVWRSRAHRPHTLQRIRRLAAARMMMERSPVQCGSQEGSPAQCGSQEWSSAVSRLQGVKPSDPHLPSARMRRPTAVGTDVLDCSWGHCPSTRSGVGERPLSRHVRMLGEPRSRPICRPGRNN